MNLFKRMKDKWNQVNSPENVAAFNEKMKQSMIGGGIVGGGMKSVRVPNSTRFIQAADDAQRNPSIRKVMSGVDFTRKMANKQLTPDELIKEKISFADPTVKKIHQRLLRQERGWSESVKKASENIPNLFRRK
jgi:hypothetical protein